MADAGKVWSPHDDFVVRRPERVEGSADGRDQPGRSAGQKDYEIVSPECGELRILRYNSGRHDSTSMIFGRQITAVEAEVKNKFWLRGGEEDGFVLLGETAIERTTVQYGQELPGGAAPPPAYHQVATPPHLPPPVNNPPPTAGTNSPTVPRSVLSDVPFAFSRHLAAAVGSQSQFRVPPLRTPDLNQYCYDFHVERSVLREAGLLEEWEWRRNSKTQAAKTELMETEPVRNNPTGETQDLMTFE
ncbi:hypothetical protein Bbelb_070020 [Branchiostoma belcheri]|nr:hypothetical protein Bbelb_070020 [Branchiostoma belcheri]